VSDRLTRFLLLAFVVLFAGYVAEPYVSRLFFAAETPRPVAPRGDLADAERSTVELFQRVSPSVVHVFARPSGRDLMLMEGAEGGGVQSGSGFIWDAAGHVVTNNHVVQGARPVTIRVASGEIVSAEVVGTAPNYDLAVLRLARTRQQPPPIAIGSSADLKVGQAAFAIGNPFGLDQTLTTGVISALQRRLPTSEGREIADVIQTDASINPGNSGGPLLDSAGRLIGVNTAIFSPSGTSAGIGFAVPVDVVNRVVPQLIRGGRMPNPGIGIMAGEEAVTARLGIEGVVIVRTLPGSPAARAGLRGVDARTGEIGDIIIGVNGRPVQRLSDLTAELERTGVGKPVELTVVRDGRRQNVRIDVADVGRAPR
jgi:2-alkenal reductase